MDADELLSAIRRHVNRELKLSGFGRRTSYESALGIPVGVYTQDIRNQLQDAAVSEAICLLTCESSAQEVKRVSRRVIRKLIRERGRRKEVLLDSADDSELITCTIGNGIFGGSSLTVRDCSRDALNYSENELIEHLDRTRKLRDFIRLVGIPTWRWFLAYLLNGIKPECVRDRVRFHRLKEKFLRRVTSGGSKSG